MNTAHAFLYHWRATYATASGVLQKTCRTKRADSGRKALTCGFTCQAVTSGPSLSPAVSSVSVVKMWSRSTSWPAFMAGVI
jgi:hypothetical protein